MLKSLMNNVKRLSRDERGSVSVEAMIVFPTLIVLFAVSWVYFDVMRQQSVSHKANYTIGDILSRETEIVDEAYIDNARNLLYHLTKTSGDAADLRITVVQYNNNGQSENGSYELVWSKARGDLLPLTQNDINGLTHRLPILASGDQTIVVETRDLYIPTFRPIGLETFDIATYSFTRPRFAPQLIFEGINDGSDKRWENNGWGNGDQDAPGGSLCHNNAENATNCDGSSKKGNGKGNKHSS